MTDGPWACRKGGRGRSWAGRSEYNILAPFPHNQSFLLFWGQRPKIIQTAWGTFGGALAAGAGFDKTDIIANNAQEAWHDKFPTTG